MFKDFVNANTIYLIIMTHNDSGIKLRKNPIMASLGTIKHQLNFLLHIIYFRT